MYIQPYGKRLIIKEILEDEKTPVFIVPDAKKPQKTLFKGKVLAVGIVDGPNIVVGSTVLFHKHAPEIVQHGDDVCFLVNENDVLGLINE